MKQFLRNSLHALRYKYYKWKLRNSKWEALSGAPNPICTHPHKGHLSYKDVIKYELK